jgi:hypothetical protein
MAIAKLKQWAARRRCSGALEPWVGAAVAVHVALLLALLAAAPGGARRDGGEAALLARQLPSPNATDPVWLDLVEAREPAVPSSAPAASDASLETRLLSAAAAPRPAAPRRYVASVAREGARPSASASARAAEGPAHDTASTEATASPEGAGSVESHSRSAEGAPHLSLQQLGVGGGPNPFMGSPSELPSERQQLNQRLRQSLRGDLARYDQRHGLGPEGPAVAAVKELVLASATAPNTSALLRVRTDATGKVTLVDVLDADRDDAEWGRIADQLVRALAGKRLRVPPRSGGVSFQLRVVSRVQLPSGADPGLAVDLFGIPLKEGDGDRSSKLSFLSPMLREMVIPGSDGVTMLVPSLAIFGLAADPVDIGSVARRLVTAYLVAMDTDISSEAAATPAPPPAARSPERP